ncbi:MAG: cysteine desulfurase [Blastocatellia bacterium]|nr:cysteine desulfurase [Blastocatellia bacterium]
MRREVYLDNNATTPVAPEVVEAMASYWQDRFGNPSSLHRKGVEAERAVRESRATIARLLGVKENEVIFTSGGTEGDNLAIKGVARALRRRGIHIITTKIEHPAVLESCRDLEAEGFRVTYLDVDADGLVTPEVVEAALTPGTILVSIMHVNNELGTILPISEIAERVKRRNPEIVVHSDGVQAIGKTPVDLRGVDLYTISGHKIHAPKGTGALIVREGVRLVPLFSGGGQERGLRSGTENVAGIVALARALELACENLEERLAYFRTLRERFLDGVRRIDRARINSPERSVPTTVNVSFPGIPAEVLLHALEEEGIFASTGAACASRKRRRSHVLEAMRLPPEVIDSSLRFSFSRYTTVEDIEWAVHALQHAVERLAIEASRATLTFTRR